MKPVLFVQNIPREGPGRFAEFLNTRNIPYQILDHTNGGAFPDPKKYGAIVVLGGPDSANDENEKIASELDFVKKVLKADIPYLGVCLGMQILAKAAGGRVLRSKYKEIGFLDQNGDIFEVELSENGKLDPFFAGVTESFPVFQLHGETVELPKEIEFLGTGKWCRNQVIKVGDNAYGLQFHNEIDEDMFKIWCNDDPDMLRTDRRKQIDQFFRHKNEFKSLAFQIFENFLLIAGMITKEAE